MRRCPFDGSACAPCGEVCRLDVLKAAQERPTGKVPRSDRARLAALEARVSGLEALLAPAPLPRRRARA